MLCAIRSNCSAVASLWNCAFHSAAGNPWITSRAAAFRRLVRHLRHRHDAQNIELMGLAGFCRNCLGDWIIDAGAPLDKAAAREVIHGMPAQTWKTRFQSEATPGQLERMARSMKLNAH